MTESLQKERNLKDEKNCNILNFKKSSTFFFKLTNLNSILTDISNINDIYPSDNDINIIKKEIQKIKESDELNNINKVISVLKIYSDRIKDLIEVKQKNSEMANKIKEIIDNYDGEKRITLKMISMEYFRKFSKSISKMTISRILRNNLNMRFRKTILKNPKLSENNYILMNFIFLKIICRCLNLGFNIIYIDETGFSLNNTNLRIWRKANEEICDGPKIDTKQKINLIMAMDKNQIIYGQYYYNETIATDEFVNFLEELLKRLSEEEKKNSVFVLDNAKYHTTDKIKKFVRENQLKFLFNIPYKSQYNCIEYAFHLMKIEINNTMIRTKKDLKNKIVSVIEDKKINSSMSKIYGYTLEKYLNFYEDKSSNFELESIAKGFLKKKRKRKIDKIKK